MDLRIGPISYRARLPFRPLRATLICAAVATALAAGTSRSESAGELATTGGKTVGRAASLSAPSADESGGRKSPRQRTAEGTKRPRGRQAHKQPDSRDESRQKATPVSPESETVTVDQSIGRRSAAGAFDPDPTPPSKRSISQASFDEVSAKAGAPFGQERDGQSTVPPSLEEQIVELRARLDALTADRPAMPLPTADPGMVPASLFAQGETSSPMEPDATGGAPGGSSPSTVLGSVFGTDAGPTSTWVYDGLTFISKDGDFRTHLGGVVQLDAIGFGSTPGITSIPDGAGTQESVTFRRLRVRADGTMYRYIDWVFEFDFAFALQNTDQLNAAAQNLGLRSIPLGVGVQAGNTINVIQPTTVFLTFKEIAILGNVRVGNQADWLGFEHIESARFLDFMERAPLADAFTAPNNNGYTPGVSAFNTTPDQRIGAQIGVYKNNAYDSGVSYNIGDAWTYGGRLIWTPFYDEQSKGRYMVHTGFGGEYRTLNDGVSATTGFDNVRIRSRGDLRNASSTLDPNYADTGNFYATSQTLIDPELVVQLGPFLFQTEYVASWFNGAKPAKNLPTELGTVTFQGGYAEVLYFLTGENRNYNRQQGVFGRVVPNANWDPKKGTWGAFQVGIRYDWLDLNSGQFVNGGNASDMTFGLNWFLNANARFQFNYVLSWVNNAPSMTFPGTLGALNGSRFVGDGTINSAGIRMDFNF